MEMKSELEQLQQENQKLLDENAELRRKILLYEKSNKAAREAKANLSKFAAHEKYGFFQRYVLISDWIDELDKNNEGIKRLLRNQETISRFISMHIDTFKMYERLCFLKEKISMPSTKVVMLLQVVGADNATEILDILFEGKDNRETLELLEGYYSGLEGFAEFAARCLSLSPTSQKVDSNSYISTLKRALWSEFALCNIPEESPKTEKERKKREIRDNTIRNFHKKHGERMFLQENMTILYANLKKVGIDMVDVSETKIKQIIKFS